MRASRRSRPSPALLVTHSHARRRSSNLVRAGKASAIGASETSAKPLGRCNFRQEPYRGSAIFSGAGVARRSGSGASSSASRILLNDALRSCRAPVVALMQHHGAPTRLFDFTRSLYVAAFFALTPPAGTLGIFCSAEQIDHSSRLRSCRGRPKPNLTFRMPSALRHHAAQWIGGDRIDNGSTLLGGEETLSAYQVGRRFDNSLHSMRCYGIAVWKATIAPCA